MCHGSFHQHNVLFSGGKTVLLQFDRCHVGVQLSDLYDFMRKVMEKWDWNPRIGLQMLSWYDGVVPLSDDEREYVRLRLSYPEKFWKITNHYYNSRKSWIPRVRLSVRRCPGSESRASRPCARVSAST